jgi:hypothetical protein
VASAWRLTPATPRSGGTLEAFLRGAEIAHFHLHDNLGLGRSDLHLPLGRGRLIPDLVQRLFESSDGLCVLKHKQYPVIPPHSTSLALVNHVQSLPPSRCRHPLC